mmetsp:Transcript_3621/g.9724  ORF Transcript_3621/g.9724 Transcript_3621/m.9724 type:complete len:212 (+) Transcript_3621:846-1481(+)
MGGILQPHRILGRDPPQGAVLRRARRPLAHRRGEVGLEADPLLDETGPDYDVPPTARLADVGPAAIRPTVFLLTAVRPAAIRLAVVRISAGGMALLAAAARHARHIVVLVLVLVVALSAPAIGADFHGNSPPIAHLPGHAPRETVPFQLDLDQPLRSSQFGRDGSRERVPGQIQSLQIRQRSQRRGQRPPDVVAAKYQYPQVRNGIERFVR